FTPGAIFGAAIIDMALALLPATDDPQTLDWHHLSAAIALATETSQSVVTHLPHVLYHRSPFAAASPEQAEPS
ncbi:glycosyl transferase family protein, partial [Pseudomonas syringae pv. actinidiae ICMP 18807]